MGLSKEHRIMILLGIDGAFFLVELIVGYAVHSLALVADAFHMLNDVLSLCVGLWAVRVANTESSEKYTYGWQRAETLGALVNGVFLVALCMSIFLEAIQRFVEPQVVSNPKLVFIVGCLGLASNILGLFLFHDHSHDHGHSHDEESHPHGAIQHAEEGHAHSHSMHGKDDEHSERTPLIAAGNGMKKAAINSDTENTTLSAWSSHSHKRRSTANSGAVAVGHHRRRTSAFGSADDIPVHPASMRQGIFRAAQFEGPSSDVDAEEAVVESQQQTVQNGSTHHHQHEANFAGNGKQSHANHFHAQPRPKQSGGGGGHGHSHDDLNMRGVFLHVLGDALGNIGVIATALFIWLTDWSFRYYFDPAISLLITVIILCSAIPLCKAASRILLQATPESISIEEIRQDIETLDGVDSAHHLHVWQLSDTKLVASLHVKVNCEIQGAGSEAYMHLAREIQQCLHGYGIHSSTIQPEFIPEADSYEHGGSSQTSADRASKSGNSKTPSMTSLKGQACMLDCEEECSPKKKCCPTNATSQEAQGHGGTSKGGPGHNHGHGHTH